MPHPRRALVSRGPAPAVVWGHAATTHRNEALARIGLHSPAATGRLAGPLVGRQRRTLTLASPLVAALREHRRKQIVRSSWRLVFVTRSGRPRNGTNVTHTLQRHLAEAGLPRIRFHDLRHEAATYLLEAGVLLKEVSDLLGTSRSARPPTATRTRCPRRGAWRWTNWRTWCSARSAACIALVLTKPSPACPASP